MDPKQQYPSCKTSKQNSNYRNSHVVLLLGVTECETELFVYLPVLVTQTKLLYGPYVAHDIPSRAL